MPSKVGVVAIQGDFSKHIDAINRLNDREITACQVRTADDLAGVDRLILPGGESTTVGLLMERYGLGEAIIAKAAQGMPVWGTCMGMILMAKSIEGRQQYSLGLLDITVRRNAFGAQIHSFEDSVEVSGLEEPVTGVFIRAPIVISHGASVKVLAEYNGQVVAVRQGSLLGTSFHPELTPDLSLHRYFVSMGEE